MIKCISWNILAQRFLKEDQIPKEYEEEFKQGQFDWPARLELIKTKLLESGADLIFLQEVELNDFSKDFAFLFDTYASVRHTINKKRTNPIGNVTLWKPSTLSYTKDGVNSCSVYVQFEFETKEHGQREFWTQNLHLKSGLRSCKQERLNQINSCLRMTCESLPGLITGDFNDDLDPNNGSLLPGRFKGWQVDSAGTTCMNLSRHTGQFEHWSFDHVVSKELTINLDKTTPLHTIPSPTEPSDHYSISFQIDF